MKYFLRAYHLFFSAVVIYTLGFILFHGVDLVSFFSHISNLVNILAAGVFLYLGITDDKKLHEIDSLRAATVVYVVTIGIAFILLQEKEIGPMAYPWISFVQHKLIPVSVVLEWILLPPVNKLSISDTFKWFLFPIIYFVYTQIYGYFTNSYPYTFLDPQVMGFFSVFLYFLGVLVGGFFISLITIFIGNKLQKTN